jgi:hypothetical protein
MKQIIGAQGEITIIKIDSLPEGIETKKAEKSAKGWIVSHSESGHHHVLTDGEVMERVDSKVPEGMKILYGILDGEADLIQDAPGNPHEGYNLEQGLYEFRISREYDPFMEQARIVAD